MLSCFAQNPALDLLHPLARLKALRCVLCHVAVITLMHPGAGSLT